MFFWKKQSKRKMNLSRKIMAFVLAGVLLLSSVGMNVSAQEIVTKKSTISKNTKVDIYKATVQSGNGERTYRVFAQTSKKYKKNSFISLHGCAVKVRVDSSQGHPYISVADTGIGISKEHQKRVFERFYREDKSRSKQTRGTGLGLAIVKHIVALHDAQLNLESEIGKGTTITVTF